MGTNPKKRLFPFEITSKNRQMEKQDQIVIYQTKEGSTETKHRVSGKCRQFEKDLMVKPIVNLMAIN